MMAMIGGQESDRTRRARARTRVATTSSSDDQNSSLFPGTDVVVPGTFVVFHGNSGDGLSNTIQSLPTVPPTRSSAATVSSPLAHTSATSVLNPLPEHEYETVETPGGLPLGQLATAPITAAAARLVASAAAAASATTVSATETVDSSDDFVDPMSTSGMSSSHSRSSTTDEFIVVGDGSFSPSRQSSNEISPSDRNANTAVANGQRDSEPLDLDEASIRQWERGCREVETQQRREWSDSLRHVPPHLLDHCMMATSAVSSSTGERSNDNDTNDHEEEEEEDPSSCSLVWWQSYGKVAVLNDLPQNDPTSGKVKRSVIAMLNPGSTVHATKIIHLDSSTLSPIEVPTLSMPSSSSSSDSDDQKTYPQGQKGWIQMLELQIDPNVMTMKNPDTNTSETTTGYAVLSLDGYPFLGPGSPSLYVDPNQWVWRVTCPVGAFVRDGVELTTRHIDTIPFGSMINVSKRCINNQGLSRLQAQQYVVDPSSDSGSYRRVCGWISELLNPLSGQRGVVAQPLPFPVPALYKVTLTVGAVIRKGIELSSPQIGQAPHGAILKIVGRAFSEHPVDRSIERLQLAGNGGWISVRLNRPPPHDELVVEFVDVDGTFDPKDPGRYHLTARRATLEAARERRAATRRAQNDRSSHDDISSINEDDLLYDHEEDAIESPTRHAAPNLSAENGTSTNPDSLKCVVCLTSDRNACLVHGETGHIVCCLVCARILKARGDKCPVCRLPISSVIQHFYA